MVIKNEITYDVKLGGIILIKPQTFNASNKSTNDKRRRVIHLEFNTLYLAPPLTWLEYQVI